MNGILADNFLTGNDFWALDIPDFLDRGETRSL